MGRRKGSRHIDIPQRINGTGEKAPWYRLLELAIVCRAVQDYDTLHACGKDFRFFPNGEFICIDELDIFAKSDWCATLMTGVSDWDESSLARLAKS